jgi:hypothetical protein
MDETYRRFDSLSNPFRIFLCFLFPPHERITVSQDPTHVREVTRKFPSALKAFEGKVQVSLQCERPSQKRMKMIVIGLNLKAFSEVFDGLIVLPT